MDTTQLLEQLQQRQNQINEESGRLNVTIQTIQGLNGAAPADEPARKPPTSLRVTPPTSLRFTPRPIRAWSGTVVPKLLGVREYARMIWRSNHAKQKAMRDEAHQALEAHRLAKRGEDEDPVHHRRTKRKPKARRAKSRRLSYSEQLKREARDSRLWRKARRTRAKRANQKGGAAAWAKTPHGRRTLRKAAAKARAALAVKRAEARLTQAREAVPEEAAA